MTNILEYVKTILEFFLIKIMTFIKLLFLHVI